MKPQRLCFRAVEFRANDSNDGFTLEGYAAVFGSPTRIDSFEGRFDEVIARGAFAKTLAERMPVLQFDHGKDVRTGSVPIGAIEDLREDEHGLFVRARLFDNAVVEPIRQAIAGGAIDGMSFRFRVLREEWRDASNKPVSGRELSRLMMSAGDRGPLKRNISEVELYELGPVVFPAYAATSVGVRSMIAGLNYGDKLALVEELRDLLRSAVSPHDTDTVDRPWDSGEHEKRLPSPMTVETARDFYAWIDNNMIEDGELPKSAGKFPHHEVDENGNPGPANLAAVRNALARLSQADIPASDRAAVERHLRRHLEAGQDEEPRSDDQEPANAARTSTFAVSTGAARTGTPEYSREDRNRRLSMIRREQWRRAVSIETEKESNV